MIEYLRVRNLAIIEDAELELGPGMTVLTGETGAGKSIVVGALAALRGARVARDAIRDGADRAVVEAVLRVETDDGDEGVERGSADAGELLVERTVMASGRSRQRIDGKLATVGGLAEWVGPRVDISGQHDGQSLTDPTNHRALLDAARGPDGLRDAVRDAVEHVRDVKRRIDRLGADERERAARIDLLTFQLEELDAIQPDSAADRALEAERRRLANASELQRLAGEAVELVYEGDGAAVELLGRAERALSHAAELDPDLGPLAERLREIRMLGDDVSRELTGYVSGIDGDPARLEWIEERLLELARLQRKHGVGAEGLAPLAEGMREELESLEGAGERRQELDEALRRARDELRRAARKLTVARQAAGEILARAVETNLERLGMAGARFWVDCRPLAARESDDEALLFGAHRVASHGGDRVEFLVAPNPGEQPRPLASTASGGELSRIMLAIKLVLADRDTVGTYVFDEVDAGVGGVAADAVGRALAQVAVHRQVLCITHLPQIAAFATRHLRVSKRQVDGRTVASIEALSPRNRVAELARMIGGARVTKKTRPAAAELLEAALTRRG